MNNIHFVEEFLKIKYSPIKVKLMKIIMKKIPMKADFKFDIKDEDQTKETIETQKMIKNLISQLRKSGKTRSEIIEILQQQLSDYNLTMSVLPKLVYKFYEEDDK